MPIALAALAAAAATTATPAPQALPKDIHPKSLSRLAPIERDKLSPEGQRVYDVMRGSAPAIPVTGPGPNSMYSPVIAEPMHHLNQNLRRSVVGPRYFELAALTAAREFDQAYEWTGHEGAGRRAGLTDAEIDALKFDRPVTGLPEKDATVITLGRALMRDHKVSSELWAKTVALFGAQGAVDIVVTFGDYTLAGFLLTAVDQHLPPERPSTLPPKPAPAARR
jgi:4-carboxymuconolactone decarboxylase